MEYKIEAIHKPLNIPCAKNMWASKSKFAGVRATPIQEIPPRTPNKVAKKVNKFELKADLIE